MANLTQKLYIAVNENQNLLNINDESKIGSRVIILILDDTIWAIINTMKHLACKLRSYPLRY